MPMSEYRTCERSLDVSLFGLLLLVRFVYSSSFFYLFFFLAWSTADSTEHPPYFELICMFTDRCKCIAHARRTPKHQHIYNSTQKMPTHRDARLQNPQNPMHTYTGERVYKCCGECGSVYGCESVCARVYV